MKRLAYPLSLLLLLAAALPGAGISLWNNGGRGNADGFYAEIKGLSVGDIVTVVIVERATASNKATTQNKKSTELSSSAGTGPLSVIKSMGVSTESDFQGDGETTRTTRLETHVSARVTKVLPNGNMLIEGQKFNQINNEVQEIRIRGMVRPVDIAADNTVLSTALADADIRLTGKGGASEASRPSLVNRLFNLIF